MRRGYIRLSRAGPSLEDQIKALESAGIVDFSEDAPVYIDVVSEGRRAGELPARSNALRSLEVGDELVVANAARLGTTLADVVAVLRELGKRGAALVNAETGEIIRWHPDATAVVAFAQRADAANRMEITAKMRKERVASGRLGSRPVKGWNISEDAARILWADLTKSAAEVAEKVGVSIPTLYRRLGERGSSLKDGLKTK